LKSRLPHGRAVSTAAVCLGSAVLGFTAAPAPPVFVDATEAAGIRWGIQELASRGPNLIETMGGGGGFVDYDGDGWLDLYLVSYSTRPQDGRVVGDALYRNNRDGTFTDVTRQAGIAGERRGMGLAVGDYDNDGWTDLYGGSVSSTGRPAARSEAVTAKAAVDNRRWGCGHLPRLRPRRPARPVRLELPRVRPGEPGPLPVPHVRRLPVLHDARFQQPSVLFHNRGDGSFEDRSAAAGIAGLEGKGMGVIAADLDDDGLVDLFQANDSSPNFLFRNLGDGRFRDVALDAGVAYDASGRTTGAMAPDAEDVDGDGRLDLLVTNFNNQGTFLHRNNGGMSFSERGPSAGLSLPTFKISTFGARFLDYDNDGDPDLFIASGHPFAPVAKVWPEIHHADPPFLFENDASRFRDVARERGEALSRPHVGRGVAVADYDNDGDPDVLLLAVGRRGSCATTAATGAAGWACARGHAQRPGRRRGAGHVTTVGAGTHARVSAVRATSPRLTRAAVRPRRRRRQLFRRGALAQRPRGPAGRLAAGAITRLREGN
jgi:hypothetical protein